MMVCNKTTSRTRFGSLLIIIGSLLTITACSDEQAPDPVVLDLPIAYIKRSISLDEDGELVQEDIRDPYAFNAGAQLILRDRAAPNATEEIISANVFADDVVENTEEEPDNRLSLIDIKDLEVSYDGMKLIFAMRAPELENVDEDEQPTWNIWEYDRETQVLRRIISSDIIAEEGQDIAPHYLPDGRIVFSSTRQRQSRANLLDEGKPQYPALDENGDVETPVLHVMNADGSDIHQISFNQSHDLDPSVLSNGKIVYTRWDNLGSNDGMHLYSINPDGTELSVLYGINSHQTGTEGATTQFMQAKEMPDGRLLVLQKQYESLQSGGDIIIVDATNFVDVDQPLAGDGSTGGQESASVGNVTTNNTLSRAGRFNSAWPLFDGTNRLLVTWSQCRLLETTQISETETEEQVVPCTDENVLADNVVEAAPLYGLYVYDLDLQTQLPIVQPEEGINYDNIVAMEPKALPEVRLDNSAATFDAELAAQGVGAIHIRSVYDFDGNDVSEIGIAALADPAITLADDRPARFVRVVKAVPLPDEDLVDIPGTAFGASANQLMREIVGYSTVAPDGSVKMQIPANIPFMVSVLDQYGRRITNRHEAWMQLRPGEVLECNGCHDPDSTIPHGRLDAQASSINTGAPSTDIPFLNSSPDLLPVEGETMAETVARINGTAQPNLDIGYQDIWTDEAVRAKDADINYEYRNLTTQAPVLQNCISEWNATCRIVINYETVIQPLWTKDRQVLDVDGITVLTDNTCTACHAPVNAMAAAKVPDAQLDLSEGPSVDEPDHFTSYRELLFNDNEQEVVDGVLLDRQVPRLDANGNPVFQTDGNGDLILDANGDAIPLTDPVTVSPSLSPAGSIASARFVELFLPGGSHENRLTLDELKLVTEWLDIGAQYYNNPFDVPQ